MSLSIETSRRILSSNDRSSFQEAVRSVPQLSWTQSSLVSLQQSRSFIGVCLVGILHGFLFLWMWAKRLMFLEKTSLQSVNLFSANHEQNAELLVKEFLALKKNVQKNSGYCVQLTSPDHRTFQFKIEPQGEEDREIQPPSGSFVKDCRCCKSVFEHAYKSEPADSFYKQLSAKIRKHDTLAVRSLTGNLLLVPDTFKAKVKIDEHRHLFQLDNKKLKKMFLAILETMSFIRSHDPSYLPNIKWHVGKEARQSVWLLHTRFEKS